MHVSGFRAQNSLLYKFVQLFKRATIECIKSQPNQELRFGRDDWVLSFSTHRSKCQLFKKWSWRTNDSLSLDRIIRGQTFYTLKQSCERKAWGKIPNICTTLIFPNESLLTESTCAASIGYQQSSVNAIRNKHIQECPLSVFVNANCMPGAYVADELLSQEGTKTLTLYTFFFVMLQEEKQQQQHTKIRPLIKH